MKRKIFREDIIKVGQELMFLNGYNATGIKEITDEVNIPKGSFYNHFSSKEEFGQEVLKTYCDHGVRHHEKNLLESKLSPIKRIEAHYTEMIKFLEEERHCKLGCIMSNFSLELGDVNESFRTILEQEFDACESIIVHCLNEAQALGEIKKELNTKLVGAFILNSWHGALVRMKSTANTKPLEDFKSFILQQITN